jgi:hypothetical protein
MLVAGHADLSAKIFGSLRDALVVSGNNNVSRSALPRALVDVLEHRLAVDIA